MPACCQHRFNLRHEHLAFSLVFSIILSFSQIAIYIFRRHDRAAHIGTGPPLCGGLQHDRSRRDRGRGCLRRQGQLADADGPGPAASLLSKALPGGGHHAGDGYAGDGLLPGGRLLRAAGRSLYPYLRTGIRHRVQRAKRKEPLFPVRQAAAGQPAYGADGTGDTQDRAGAPLRRRGGDAADEPVVRGAHRLLSAGDVPGQDGHHPNTAAAVLPGGGHPPHGGEAGAAGGEEHLPYGRPQPPTGGEGAAGGAGAALS